MPRVTVAEGAARGLERCAAKAPDAARRAGQTIAQQLLLLEHAPDIGRPLPEAPALLRDLVTQFGDSGYVALYRHDEASAAVHVLAFKHQKEAGY